MVYRPGPGPSDHEQQRRHQDDGGPHGSGFPKSEEGPGNRGHEADGGKVEGPFGEKNPAQEEEVGGRGEGDHEPDHPPANGSRAQAVRAGAPGPFEGMIAD